MIPHLVLKLLESHGHEVNSESPTVRHMGAILRLCTCKTAAIVLMVYKDSQRNTSLKPGWTGKDRWAQIPPPLLWYVLGEQGTHQRQEEAGDVTFHKLRDF